MQIIAPDLGIRNRSDIKLLLQGDGADQSTVFLDRAFGSSLKSPVAGCGFGYFNGSSSLLSVPDSTDWSALCADVEWTFEGLIYLTSLANCSLFARHNPSNPYTGFKFGIDATGTLYLYHAAVSGSPTYFTTKVVANTLYRISFVRKNGVIRCYLNGVCDATTASVQLTNYASALYIGRNADASNYFPGLITEVHVSSIARYTTNFSIPTTKFTADSYTKLLLHFDVLGSATITDYSATPKTITNTGVIQINGNPVTRVGDTKIVAQDLRHPYARSAAFYPGSSKLSCADNVDVQLWNQNFVIEGWINQAQTISSPIICAKASSGLLSYAFAKYDATYMAFLWSTDGTTWGQYVTFPWQPTIGKHQFIAISRSGNVLRFYAEGDKKGTDQACSATFLANAGAFDIGKYFTTSFSDFIGSMIDLRLSVGTDRGYTGATIPVPTGPLPSDPYTKLLIRGDNVTQPAVFVDKSPSPKTITTTGNVAAVPLPPGSSAIYMDGSVDSLTAPSSDDSNFGTGDFTLHWLECPLAVTSGSGVVTRSLTENIFYVGYFGSGNPEYFLASSNGTTWDIANGLSLGIPIVGAWAHCAIVRSGLYFLAFRNGNLISSITSSAAIKSTTQAIAIGTAGSSAASAMNGYLRAFTVARRALWTRNFTPPNRLA